MRWLFILLSLNALANPEIIQNSYFDFISESELKLTHQHTHAIDLTLVVDQDSKWTEKKIKKLLRKTQRPLFLYVM